MLHSLGIAGYLHDGSADKRNTDHEGPAGNNTECPQEVRDWLRKAVLGERAVEGMEVTLIRLLLLP